MKAYRYRVVGSVDVWELALVKLDKVTAHEPEPLPSWLNTVGPCVLRFAFCLNERQEQI